MFVGSCVHTTNPVDKVRLSFMSLSCRSVAGFIEEKAGGTVEQFQQECKEALQTLEEFSPRRLVSVPSAKHTDNYATTTVLPGTAIDRLLVVLELVTTTMG